MIKNVVDMGLMPGTTTRSTAIKGGPAVSRGCDRACLVLRGGRGESGRRDYGPVLRDQRLNGGLVCAQKIRQRQ